MMTASAIGPRISAPILLGLALHRWRLGIFDLHPMQRAARAIGRAKPFADNALATETARLAVDNNAKNGVCCAAPVSVIHERLRGRGCGL
jgi:hypothetical protein